MAEPKTRPTDVDPNEFIGTLPEPLRRERAEHALALMNDETGDAPVMWGPSIIGYGSVRLKYASGRELDWPRVGFSPRKGNMVFYGIVEHESLHPLLERLGAHTTGAGCLYVKRFEDVDEAVLRELVRRAYELANEHAG